jgi:hypothetical protein
MVVVVAVVIPDVRFGDSFFYQSKTAQAAVHDLDAQH